MARTLEAPTGGYGLVLIPGGTFTMGSRRNEKGRAPSEGPLHRVQVPSFYLGRCPVTNAEYRRFLELNPTLRSPAFFDDMAFNQPTQPVVGVSFEDAARYCQWAGLRLPSEAEWEYACRAGTTTRYYNGGRSSSLQEIAWYSRCAQRRLHAVGRKVPNAFGLYDMLGNVWEWCEDDWHDSYDGAPSNGRAWLSEERTDARVLRGGSWFGNHSDYLRSACRRVGHAELEEFNVGFRCALAPPPGISRRLATNSPRKLLVPLISRDSGY